eukprot:6209750-Pleurochrysis_carterae.AAC.1
MRSFASVRERPAHLREGARRLVRSCTCAHRLCLMPVADSTACACSPPQLAPAERSTAAATLSHQWRSSVPLSNSRPSSARRCARV